MDSFIYYWLLKSDKMPVLHFTLDISRREWYYMQVAARTGWFKRAAIPAVTGVQRI